MEKAYDLLDGVPCGHGGCLQHLTHPCENCGRIGGISGFNFSKELAQNNTEAERLRRWRDSYAFLRSIS